MWHFETRGTGRPLVLLHGIGMSHAAWGAVVPYLCAARRVIAVDIPGFGSTPPLPPGVRPTIPHLVDDLERFLNAIGIDVPVDMAGNSLGGRIALEAARRGLARTVVAISPPGLWREHGAMHVPYVFAALRLLATTLPHVLQAIVRIGALRELALALPLSSGSRRMPARDAVRAISDLAEAQAFEETFATTQQPFRGRDIAVPVTIAFGDRDWILTRGSRRRTELPLHTRWLVKHGWGHVPMWVDPPGVARLILEGSHETESPA